MDIKNLPTEQQNPDTMAIDEAGTSEILRMINNEDKKVAFCIEKKIDAIAKAVDALTEVFENGGRIIYCGAGTSGRLGFMDCAEIPPTFGLDSGHFIPLIAGGEKAIKEAQEGAEDSQELCVEDLKAVNLSSRDAVVGIAASGRTPYVLGGLKYANSLGCVTASISCNEDAENEMNKTAKYPIGIYAGPEVITGSTRMKAGTVQKLVLNMISTSVMIKTGKVYGNLMVNVKTTNQKLVDRAVRIIGSITCAPTEDITEAMKTTGNNVPLSIIMLLTGLDLESAKELLAKNNGKVKAAIKDHTKA